MKRPKYKRIATIIKEDFNMKKTTMKRLVALMLSTSFAVSATDCGGQYNAGSAADTQSSNTSLSNPEVYEQIGRAHV